jgi:hypothetical protein
VDFDLALFKMPLARSGSPVMCNFLDWCFFQLPMFSSPC